VTATPAQETSDQGDGKYELHAHVSIGDISLEGK
jgi:hypothetical protein